MQIGELDVTGQHKQGGYSESVLVHTQFQGGWQQPFMAMTNLVSSPDPHTYQQGSLAE